MKKLLPLVFFASFVQFTIAQTISTGSVAASYNTCNSLTVNYTITGSFNPGNIFTAQLSNDLGSFASPVAIGNVTSQVAGSISATIPYTSLAGILYRIRVVSSNPVITGTDNGNNISISICTNTANTTGSATGCSGGYCTFSCATGFSNCDGTPANGCEVNTTSDINHCSACGNVCPARTNATLTGCVSSACTYTCNAGWYNPDGNWANGCENSNPTPTITSFSPASGPAGTLVTIIGTNMSSPTAFTIGGANAIVVSNTGTQLVGLVMPGAATGTISVSTAGGTATGTGNFTVTQTPFPSAQQGNKLVGTGGTGQAYQGRSVSVSADGNTAIVGGINDNSGKGAAWIYTRSGGVWTQEGSKLVGTGAVGLAYQGISVSLSSDGNTAVVGGYNDNSSAGAAWIYIRTAGVWTQQGSKLVGTGAVGTSYQGSSVSISSDGNTVIVGGYSDNSGAGAVWVFTRSGGVWSQQGNKLIGTGAVGAAYQGKSVSLSSDGNTVIVGGDNDNSYAGAVWVFTRSGGVWTQQGSKLVGTGAVGVAYQGISVAVSADGNTAIVGGYTDNSYAGAAWIYTRTGGVWTQQGSKLVGTGAAGAARQGISVSLSSDGNTAIVGGNYDNGSTGAAWIFTRSGGVWTQQGSKLVGTGGIGGSYQGLSISISSDGNTATLGGGNDNNGEGAAWVFTRTGGIWSQQGNKLVGTESTGAASQGYAVAISADGNTAIVGGHNEDNNAGAIWIYTRSGSIWTQQGSKLVGTGAAGVATQGYAVSISSDGNTAIVGGYSDNSGAGAVWVFTRSGGVWSQQGNKLIGTGAVGAAYQGYAVSISSDGNTAIVGGYADNGSAGAVWIYIRSGGVWSQQGTKLVGTGATGAAQKGISVSISSNGNTAIVGGNSDNSSAGAAWVFTRSGGVWTQQGSKLVGTGATGAGRQGISVSLSSDGNTAIVGGDADNSYAGAAWIYTRSGGIWTQQGSKLVGTGGIGSGRQGISVSISSDGNSAIVGGYSDNTPEGAAWIFTVPPPTITSFSPASGSVGTLVTITGTDLGSPTAFTIGGANAIVVSNTGTQLVGLVMPGAVTGSVSVATTGGSAAGASNFTVTPTPYPSIQQGNKLVGTGAVGASNQGYAVAISADGNTAIVGGHGDDLVGAAWIYTRTGGVWAQQGSKLTGTGLSGYASHGISVGISADGNTAIVGAGNDNSGVGAALIYARSGGVWTQQGTKLVGTGATGSAYQGVHVSISADGNTVIVAGSGDNSFVGATWVYVRSGGVWTQQGSKLVGTGVVGAAQQGASVALSSDGQTAIVGGHADNSNVGAVWIFTRSGGVWTQQGSKLVGTGAVGSANQGTSVAIAADGNTAIVGGQHDNGTTGAAWVFTRSAGVWTQQGSKLLGTGAVGTPAQGIAVALSADGNTAIVGGYGDNGAGGAAWNFTRSAGVWTQQGTKVVGTGATGSAGQGYALAISSDGYTAMIGGYTDNSSVGAAWAFIPCIGPTVPTLNTSATANCGTKSTTLTIASGTLNSATTWEWYSGSCGGTSVGSGTSVVVSPTITTTYYARGEGGCVSTGTCASLTVTVNTPPTVALGADVTQCGGNIILDAGNAGSTYAWSPAGTTQTISALTTGTYSVLVTDANTCTGTDVKLVTINTPPTVALGADVTQCGGNIILDAGNAGATYAWSPAGTTQTITALATNTYSVLVTDANTCTGTDVKLVTINTPPTVALGADVTQCGGNILLDAGNAGATYVWSPAGTTQTISALTTGTYSVVVTDANNCTGTDIMDVTINPLPTIATGGNTTICTGGNAILTASGGTVYLWAPGGETTTSITVSPTSSANYTVTVTDANGCSDIATDSVTVDQCLGTTTILGEQTFTVYPNPSTGLFYISFFGKATEIFVTDIVGRKVFASENRNEKSIDISSTPSGIYFLHVKTGNGDAVRKIIKE